MGNTTSHFEKDKAALYQLCSSIKSQCNAAGGKIVFEKIIAYGFMMLHQKGTGQITISQQCLPKEKTLMSGIISQPSMFHLTAKSLLSRELFVSDAEEVYYDSAWFQRKVSEVKWLSDNKTLLFNQTWMAT